MNTRSLILAGAGVAAAVGATALAYVRLRPRLLAYGATTAEAAAALPGDEFLPDAAGVSTRAISVPAPPEAIYPWIVQMGPVPRGGAYTYDWIENLLGLNFHSTDRILDEFQHPVVGEELAFGPRPMVIVRADRDRTFVIESADRNWVWSFNLIPDGEETRLISRNRFRIGGGGPVEAAVMELMVPGSLIMERKMLRGIRDRAILLHDGGCRSGEECEP